MYRSPFGRKDLFIPTLPHLFSLHACSTYRSLNSALIERTGERPRRNVQRLRPTWPTTARGQLAHTPGPQTLDPLQPGRAALLQSRTHTAQTQTTQGPRPLDAHGHRNRQGGRTGPDGRALLRDDALTVQSRLFKHTDTLLPLPRPNPIVAIAFSAQQTGSDRKPKIRRGEDTRPAPRTINRTTTHPITTAQTPTLNSNYTCGATTTTAHIVSYPWRNQRSRMCSSSLPTGPRYGTTTCCASDLQPACEDTTASAALSPHWRVCLPSHLLSITWMTTALLSPQASHRAPSRHVAT